MQLLDVLIRFDHKSAILRNDLKLLGLRLTLFTIPISVLHRGANVL